MALFLPNLSEVEEKLGITAIAIDEDKNSQLAVKWAVENFFNHKSRHFILVHVRIKTFNPQGFDAVPKEGRPPTQQEAQLFLPYRGFCARKGVELKEVVIHDIDIARALVNYIGKNCIDNIILGASTRNPLTRKFRNLDIPSTLLKLAPESCGVYVISRGKIQSQSRPQAPTSAAKSPRQPQTPTSTAIGPRKPETPTSDASHRRQVRIPRRAVTPPGQPQAPKTPPATPRHLQMLTHIAATRQQNHQGFLPFLLSDSPEHEDITSNPLSMAPREELTFSYQTLTTSMDGRAPNALKGDFVSCLGEFSGPPSLESTEISSEDFEFSITSESPRDFSPTPHCENVIMSTKTLARLFRDHLYFEIPDIQDQAAYCSLSQNVVEAEIRRLKLELKQSMEMYSSVCKEAVMARHMASQLQHLHALKTRKLDEAKLAEEAALSLAEMEKQKAKTAIEAAKMAQMLAQMEAQKRQTAEKRAIQEAEERKKAIKCLAQNSVLYRQYTIEEIEVATNYFESSNKIGEGGYGPVFKATLDHTPVAIKVLRPDLSQGQRQFHKEVQVLSNVRHPHMVILLGACPEYGCLVYEYMEKGSLEDCLFRKGNTPPIPWRKRFSIASEISTGLLFLHETKPEPLVHRDLKPGNILLDRNYVSKISDVGLARLVPLAIADNISQYCQTEAAGTFCYIDPEYQQTGLLGVKSDIYSLGIVLLQLITAKNPMGLSHQVAQAIEEGTFSDILDQTQTDWPVEEALSLAKLALKCCELRKRDRPDLASVVLPELNRLRDLALANEADENQTFLPLPHPYVSVSEGKCHASQDGISDTCPRSGASSLQMLPATGNLGFFRRKEETERGKKQT
ncbi:U-box domain-containing protein 35 [Populus alba]|uniref:U-box domain-containing protein 35 n=1 Tax=Populus alba TaxID=43335 RepID=UPI00158E35F7|nr:putative U-box domain-containing protein 53 [Populus alba]